MAAERGVIGDLEVRKAAGAARAEASASRIVSADLGASLERFDDPTLLSEGKVTIIALDAVVQRFGAKWQARKTQVYDHVERTLQRYLGVQGYYLRVSETDFIICQPHLGVFANQASCLRYLREILSHFLGEAHLADDCIHSVTRFDEHGVQASRVDARHAEVAEVREEAERKLKEDLSARRVDQWSPFVASDGRELRVSCTLEPVFELKGFGRIGFRMVRRVLVVGTDEELTPGAVTHLSRADILRIDLATIARGTDRLRSEAHGERQPSLIVPVSFTSLSSQKGRAEIVNMFKEASSLVQRGVICEVCDIEGVPQGALLSAVSLIRPFSLFVVGRLTLTLPQAISGLKGAGLQALSCECPPRQGEAEFMGWAKATIDAAKQITKSFLMYRTDSPRSAGLAGLLGATHASVRAS
jgi:hypothetical protein